MRAVLCLLLLFSINVNAALQADRVATFEGGLDQPSDVAISKKGYAYVLDGVNNRVVVFDEKAKQLFSFGRSDGLKLPMAIAIADEQVLVADTGNHRIAVFNLDGQLVKYLTLTGEKAAEPVALAINEGVVSWSDRRNHQVCRHEIKTGEQLVCWGKRGEQDGEFQFPFQIKHDRDGYLQVVDVINARVQGFDQKGRRFGQTGRFGLAEGELYRPNGLALRERHLLVSDAYRGMVSVFHDGDFDGYLMDRAAKPIKFSAPVALSYWQNKLYVVDALKNRVEVFLISDVENEFAKTPQKKRSDTSQKNCISCHLAWADDYVAGEGVQDGSPPVASEAMCYSCHHGAVIDSRQSIGRGEQHPDIHHQRKENKKHKDKKREDEIPKVFPLLSNKLETKKEQQLSCGSCHTPHTAGIDEADTLYSEHANPWLRVLNKNGDLCQQCHESKLASTLNKKFPLKGVNHPVGIYLKQPATSETEGYAIDENLHKGLPKKLIAQGLSLGDDKQMICQSCHQIHGAANEALTPVEIDEAQLCVACHERQHAKDEKDARKKGVHPVNIKLEKPVKVGEEEVKKITCLTCHTLHDGKEGTALLKFDNRDGKLCSFCHKEYEVVVDSDHDLRITAKDHENNFKQKPEESGVCGSCHSLHQGDKKTGFLYAGEYKKYSGKEKPLERDQICLNCHREKGVAEKAEVKLFSHPVEDMVLRSDAKVMPLIDARNEIEEFGAIACVTCHDPHRWEPEHGSEKKLIEKQKAKNQDGNVLNSFLRRRGAKDTFCVSCHGIDTRVKYKYYHDELVRDVE